ncbi:MAG: PH domain-containing protein [Candidatus Magasanikbacteria bacterium]|nr:PH domain-containing protein [Candidatus Magasanikbacteria bacterium]
MVFTAFIHQKPYEHIVYKVRHHLITLVPAILGFLVLLAIPAVLYLLIVRLFPSLLLGTFSYPLLVLAGSIYCLSIILFFYTYFVSFYLDLLIVTNDRLLHIEQQGLFARTISEVDLYKIQDITSEINGIFPSVFNYGNLLIQTAGALEKFMISSVPHPEMLRQAILDLAEADRKFHNSNP